WHAVARLDREQIPPDRSTALLGPGCNHMATTPRTDQPGSGLNGMASIRCSCGGSMPVSSHSCAALTPLRAAWRLVKRFCAQRQLYDQGGENNSHMGSSAQ